MEIEYKYYLSTIKIKIYRLKDKEYTYKHRIYSGNYSSLAALLE